MKFTQSEIKEIIKSRNGVGYHDALMRERNTNPAPYNLYNSSIDEGKRDAEKVLASYRNHLDPGHNAALKSFRDQHNYDKNSLVQSCINAAIKRNGAKKLEVRNLSYEASIKSALQADPGNKDDIGVVNKWRDFIQDKHFAVGYETWSDYEAAKQFLSENKLSTAEASLERVKKIVRNHSGEEVYVGEEEMKGKDTSKNDSQKKNKPLPSVIENRMAELRAGQSQAAGQRIFSSLRPGSAE